MYDIPRISPPSISLAAVVSAFALMFFSGCSTKNYVRTQTGPLVQKTNELDDATAANTRNLHDVDARAQSGVSKAQQSADAASQNAQTATQAANQAKQQAQEAVNRADALGDVISGLDNYKQVSDVAVTFGFDKADLTEGDKAQLDQLGTQLGSAKSYILEVTGGADSVGSAEYN